jgi:hypothetical protein
MNGDGVDPAAVAADEALTARVRVANAPGEPASESENLLVEWRGVGRTNCTPGQRRRYRHRHVVT